MLLASVARHAAGRCSACSLPGRPRPFPESAPWPFTPQPVSLQGLFLPRCRTVHLSLLNFVRLLFVWPVGDPLDSSPALKLVNRLLSTPRAFCHLLQVVDRDVKQDCPGVEVVPHWLPVSAEYNLLPPPSESDQPTSFLPVRLCTHPDRNILNWMQKPSERWH